MIIFYSISNYFLALIWLFAIEYKMFNPFFIISVMYLHELKVSIH